MHFVEIISLGIFDDIMAAVVHMKSNVAAVARMKSGVVVVANVNSEIVVVAHMNSEVAVVARMNRGMCTNFFFLLETKSHTLSPTTPRRGLSYFRTR